MEFYIGQVVERTFGDKLSIVILKKILFINSLSVVWAKRFGVSLFNVIFVLKEKGEITLLLTVYKILLTAY